MPKNKAALAGRWLRSSWMALLVFAAAGQDPPPPPSVKELEALALAVKTAAGLDDAARQAAVTAYDNALLLAKDLEDWRQRADDLETLRATAPARLAEIREELARPPETPPSLGGDRPQPDLEHELASAQLAFDTASKTLAGLEQESATRAERRVQLPQLITAARERLADATVQSSLPPDPQDPAMLVEARRARALTRRAAIAHEITALERELASFEIRGELLAAQRDLATRHHTQAEQRVAQAQRQLSERRQALAEQAAQAAQRALEAAQPLLSSQAQERLAALAQRNAALAHQRTVLAGSIQALIENEAMVRAKVEALDNETKAIDKRIKAAGLTDAIGLQLRRLRGTLPSPRAIRSGAAAAQAAIAEAQLQQIELEDERALLVDLDRAVASEVAAVPASERATLAPQVRELLRAQRDNLDALRKDADRRFDALVQLDTVERQFDTSATEMARFIDERVLWIRSHVPVGLVPLADFRGAFAWLGTLGDRTGAWASCTSGEVLLVLLPGLLVVLGLLLFQRVFAARLLAAGGCTVPTAVPRFAPTAQALLWTVLLTLPAPALLWLAGVGLSAAPEDSALRALSAAMRATTAGYLALELFRQTMRPCGLGEAHFGWRPARLALFRRHLPRFMATALPAALLARTFASQSNETWNGSVGRVAFLVLLVSLTLCLGRLLSPNHGALSAAAVVDAKGLFHRTRWLSYALGFLAPLTLGGLAVFGYYFSASQLLTRLEITLGLILGLGFFHEVVLRALQVARQRLAHQQQARDRARPASSTPSPAAIDPSAVGASTRELLRSAATVAVLGGGWLIWIDVLPALGFLRQVELWSELVRVTETTTGPDGVPQVQSVERLVPTTLADLVLAGIALFFTVLAARGVPGFLALTLLRRLPIQEGERYAVSTLLRYVIVGFGAGYALHLVGIGWSKLQWLAAAVGIGLGFGLQEIFANFVSGLIILFERPVRVGDYVTVGEHEGQVQRIRIRATTVRDWDRREVLIPNKDIITSRVVNWTLTDGITRIVVKVGVGYTSDTAKVKAVLLRCAHENPYVLAEPAPSAVLRSFGDSALEFELRVFLADYDQAPELVDSLHLRIHDEMRKAGIDIPFPQYEVHLKAVEPLTAAAAKTPPP